jgi:hypothetical protein
MARKYKKLDDFTDKPADDDKPDDPMREIRSRHEKATAWHAPLFRQCLEDYKFVFIPGNQWDPWLAKKRARRPTYEFNTTRQLVKQVANDQRQNRPQVKFSATNDTNVELNQVMDGMFRNDWNASSGDMAVDTAFRWGLAGGYGVFAMNTRYSDDSGFDQEIYWEEKPNPGSVKFDPAAKEYTRRDAQYAFEDERISRNEFKTRWPKAEIVNFGDTALGDPTMVDWWGQDDVLISRYWYKEPKKTLLVLMSDGRTYEEKQLAPVLDELAAAGITELKRREVEKTCLYTALVSGAEILEGPTEWVGTNIPLIPVYGELSYIDGKPYYTGMARFLRDPQMLKNFHKSVKAELIAKAPKAPYMASPEQIKGFEEMYKNVGDTDYSTLMYNRTDQGPPMRSAPPDVPSSLIQAGMEDNDDMKSIAGLYDPSLGAGNGQRSGKAVLAEQRQGNTANFDYIDNLAYSLKYAGELYAEVAPKIYDTTRTRRTLGKDGKEGFVQLNQPVLDEQTGQTIYLNDLSQVKFDTAVTIGPSYSTQRIEAYDMLMQMAQNPQLAPVVADLIAKTMDIPMADELEKRLRKMGIQAGFIEPSEQDGPPPQPPPPDPEKVAGAKLKDAQAMKAMADAEKTQVETRQIELTAPIDAQNTMADTERLQADALRNASQAGQAMGGFPQPWPDGMGPGVQ